MYRFNKLEKFLEILVENCKVEPTDLSLRFIHGNKEFGANLVFSRLDDSSDICFDCTINGYYSSAFMFDFPAIHINNFLMKYLGNSDKEQHFLLRYPNSSDSIQLDQVYDWLYQAMNNHPKFKTIFLPAILKNEMPINEPIEDKRKLKI